MERRSGLMQRNRHVSDAPETVDGGRDPPQAGGGPKGGGAPAPGQPGNKKKRPEPAARGLLAIKKVTETLIIPCVS